MTERPQSPFQLQQLLKKAEAQANAAYTLLDKAAAHAAQVLGKRLVGEYLAKLALRLVQEAEAEDHAPARRTGGRLR